MPLANLAKNVPSPGPDRVTLTGSGEALEFRRPEPEDVTAAYSENALVKLNDAAESILKNSEGLMIKPALLTHEKGAALFLLASCYQVSPEDIKANNGKPVSPVQLFLSVAARNEYVWDQIVTEFGMVFPQFTEWFLAKLGAAVPGNSNGGGKLGMGSQPSTPGEVSPPATGASSESPSTTPSPSNSAPSGDGNA